MPRRKKHGHRTNIYLSPFDMALLGFVQKTTNVTMAEQIREAIPLYVRQHPSFDPERLRAFVEKQYLRTLDEDDAKGSVRLALDAFLQGARPPLPASIPEPTAAVRSSAQEFALDEFTGRAKADDPPSAAEMTFHSTESDFDVK